MKRRSIAFVFWKCFLKKKKKKKPVNSRKNFILFV